MTIDNDIAEELTRTGAPAYTFKNVGDTIKLRISGIRKQQQTDIQTGRLLTWDNGDPKYQYEITGTDIGTGEETRIFAKAHMLVAIKEAFALAEAKPAVDGELVVKFDHTEPSKTVGFADRKIFKAKYTPPAPVADVDFDEL